MRKENSVLILIFCRPINVHDGAPNSSSNSYRHSFPAAHYSFQPNPTNLPGVTLFPHPSMTTLPPVTLGYFIRLLIIPTLLFHHIIPNEMSNFWVQKNLMAASNYVHWP